MVKFRFNIFFVISIVSMLLLIGYMWLLFLPVFEGSNQYDSLRNVAILITILLVIAVILTLLQIMER